MPTTELVAIPLELKAANEFVNKLHRHHKAVYRDKLRIGCLYNGNLVGVIQLGRPVNRILDDGLTIEVVRLCTDGTPNVCSFLYSRAARVAKELGYKKIITYILESENGASLRASGWILEKENVGGGSWSRPSRPRDLIDRQLSLFDDNKPKYSIEDKKRYCKML